MLEIAQSTYDEIVKQNPEFKGMVEMASSMGVMLHVVFLMVAILVLVGWYVRRAGTEDLL